MLIESDRLTHKVFEAVALAQPQATIADIKQAFPSVGLRNCSYEHLQRVLRCLEDHQLIRCAHTVRAIRQQARQLKCWMVNGNTTNIRFIVKKKVPAHYRPLLRRRD